MKQVSFLVLSIMSISIFRQKTYKFLSNFPRITLSRNAKIRMIDVILLNPSINLGFYFWNC